MSGLERRLSINEASFRQQIYRALELYWLWPIPVQNTTVCPWCHRLVLPEAGRPDLRVMNPTGPSLAIEVKLFKKGQAFPFSHIEPQQRRWLSMWAKDGGLSLLGLGCDWGKAGSISNPRLCYLVPWDKWLEIEDKIKPHQDSLPWDLPRSKRVLQEARLCGKMLLSPYELAWKSGSWRIPFSHPTLSWLSGRIPRDLEAWRKEWREV